MTDAPHTPTRRHLLTVSGAGLTASLAGCSTNDTETEIGTDKDTKDDNTTDGNAENDDTYTQETLEAARTIGERTRESTVRITAGDNVGTGWILDAENKHIITSSRVVTDHKDVLYANHNNLTFNATVIDKNEDRQSDAALIKMTDPLSITDPSLSVGDNNTLSEGDVLVQVGHPEHIGTWVVAIGRYTEHNSTGWFESTLPTQAGNAGGPVLNLDGELIGMTSGSVLDDNEHRPYQHTESPPDLYTKYPEYPRTTTHTPSNTIMDLVAEWTDSTTL